MHGAKIGSQGLSPRTRGKPPIIRYHSTPSGPIPANAGETPRCQIAYSCVRAYPRERGGNMRHYGGLPMTWGLSPRTRGKLKPVLRSSITLGPIPANAGETITNATMFHALRAYPRERGGNAYCPAFWRVNAGLSPRTRGKPIELDFDKTKLGPIPANAGETRRYDQDRKRFRAYPRERGGNGLAIPKTFSSAGLSPRTRGKLFGSLTTPFVMGPIPANAGETCLSTRHCR